MSLWALGFVPPASVLRMSNAVTVNPQSAKIRIHIMTMTPLRIKEGHTGKTGSIITIQCTLGTVISPGALKDRAKHLKGAGKNVTERSQDCGPQTHQGNFHSIVHMTALCFISTAYVMKRKQAQWVDDHTNIARAERFSSCMV